MYMPLIVLSVRHVRIRLARAKDTERNRIPFALFDAGVALVRDFRPETYIAAKLCASRFDIGKDAFPRIPHVGVYVGQTVSERAVTCD